MDHATISLNGVTIKSVAVFVFFTIEELIQIMDTDVLTTKLNDIKDIRSTMRLKNARINHTSKAETIYCR